MKVIYLKLQKFLEARISIVKPSYMSVIINLIYEFAYPHLTINNLEFFTAYN